MFLTYLSSVSIVPALFIAFNYIKCVLHDGFKIFCLEIKKGKFVQFV